MRVNHWVLSALAVAGTALTGACGGHDTSGPDSTGMLPAARQTFSVEYPVDGVDLGQGWHREGVRKAVATCVDFTAREDTGQEQSMDLSVVNDTSALMDALDVSVEAQFKSIGYSASGKARFAKETEVRSSSLNMLAQARVMNGVEYAAPAEGKEARRVDLTPHYRDLARRSGDRFEQECGDGFVAAVYSGAELTAMLSFDGISKKDRNDYEAGVKGSGWGIRAAASAMKKSQDEKSTSRLRVTFYQAGGSGSPLPTTEESLVAAVERLPALAAADPHDYRIVVQSYRSLPGYPAGTREDRDDFRRVLATSYGRLSTLLEETREVLDDPADYVDARPKLRERMQALHDELTRKMRTIQELSEACTFHDEDPERTPVEPCERADLDARNDYAYRVQLPALKSDVDASTKPSEIADAIIDRHVRDVSRDRCERDVADPGCLLESEIEKLRQTLPSSPAPPAAVRIPG